MSVVIITGASSGIGAALATELHRLGWSVGLIARRRELLDGLAAALGDRVAVEAADVVDEPGLAAAIARLEAALGPCDLMVANAGIGARHGDTEFDPDEAHQLMAVNYGGVVNAIAPVLPAMLARGRGHIAVVSSLAAWRGLPKSGPYSASKAAVSTLFESLRVRLPSRGVAVTTIHPGFIITPMTQKARFPMPFLMSVEPAARIMAAGLIARRREINVPWQTSWLMGLARLLPNALYDWLIVRAAPR